MVEHSLFAVLRACKKEIILFVCQCYKSSDIFYLSSSKLCHDTVCVHRWMCVDPHLCIQHSSGLISWPTFEEKSLMLILLATTLTIQRLIGKWENLTTSFSSASAFPAQMCARLLLWTQGHQSHHLLLWLCDRKNIKKCHITYHKVENRENLKIKSWSPMKSTVNSMLISCWPEFHQGFA